MMVNSSSRLARRLRLGYCRKCLNGRVWRTNGQALTLGRSLRHPEPFKCTIKLRSSEMEGLIRASCKELKAALVVGDT